MTQVTKLVTSHNSGIRTQAQQLSLIQILSNLNATHKEALRIQVKAGTHLRLQCIIYLKTGALCNNLQKLIARRLRSGKILLHIVSVGPFIVLIVISNLTTDKRNSSLKNTRSKLDSNPIYFGGKGRQSKNSAL